MVATKGSGHDKEIPRKRGVLESLPERRQVQSRRGTMDVRYRDSREMETRRRGKGSQMSETKTEGFTAEERACNDHLRQAVDLHRSMRPLHSSDYGKFMQITEELRLILAKRVLARDMPLYETEAK